MDWRKRSTLTGYALLALTAIRGLASLLADAADVTEGAKTVAGWTSAFCGALPPMNGLAYLVATIAGTALIVYGSKSRTLARAEMDRISKSFLAVSIAHGDARKQLLEHLEQAEREGVFEHEPTTTGTRAMETVYNFLWMEAEEVRRRFKEAKTPDAARYQLEEMFCAYLNAVSWVYHGESLTGIPREARLELSDEARNVRHEVNEAIGSRRAEEVERIWQQSRYGGRRFILAHVPDDAEDLSAGPVRGVEK